MKRMAALLSAGVLALQLSCASAMTAAGGLTYGDRGDEVLRLQAALSTLGYKVGKVDGSFGAYTENAVRAFQKKHGLNVDGIAGVKTREQVYAEAEGRAASQASQSGQQAAVQEVPPAQAASSPVTLSDGSFFGGNYASIYPGSSGTRVVLLQNALTQLGYSCGRADGKYGRATEAAVRAFQKARNLKADGVAGKKTLSAMESMKAGNAVSVQTAVSEPAVQAAETPVSTSLAMGMSGNGVSDLQARLKALGYYQGQVDGSFGQNTLAAVLAFQKAQGLSADGIAGQATLSRLSAAAGSAQTAQGSYRTLRSGASGQDVTALQQALRNLSYSVEVTGTYDTQTRSAVRAFQKRNGLSVDGVAGQKTQARLYTAGALPAAQDTAAKESTSSGSASSGSASSSGSGSSAVGTVRLLHWFRDIKPSIRAGQTITVYDPSSGLSWRLKLYSLGRHADCEPLTAEDTETMVKAFGGVHTWNQKAVYVKLPSGTWTVGATHDMPHLTGSVSDNNFNGHLCVHFLRDMSECEQNDPKYGVANQNTIRAAWKALTGEVIAD